MNSEKHILKHKKFRIIHPLMYIILSFILVIFIGSILLVLPISSSGMLNSLSYIDSLFLSTSAVCVTGLSPIASIGESLSIFGKIVMCVLIQIGGLSLVTIVAFIIVTARKRLNRSTANVVKEQLNQSGYGELKILLKHIIIITIIFEVFGALINLIVFCQDYPFFEALGISFFHSVSSFNNAGFDILGSTSLAAYSDNILLNLNTCFLIVAGGLGFLVYENIFGIGKYKRLTIQTKVVLIMNAILIVSSFLIVKFLQWDSITWLQAFFYSINLRTAGFSSFDVGSVITGSTAIFSAAMMFIGGSPLSTAGGIKATTFFVIIMAIFALFTGKNPVIYKRELTRESIRKALILFVLAIFGISLAIFLICLIEGGKFTFVQVFYECFSAFGTVGLSMGITTQISIGSKIVLCLLMFFGRLGPVTILTMFSPFFKHKSDDIAYLETDISIG